MDRAARELYMQTRRELQAGARELWSKAAVAPSKDGAVGNIRYVSRVEANKYGRLTRLTERTHGVIRRGLTADISRVSRYGRRIYEAEHQGWAWVYNQGYALPVTGGIRVPLMSAAVDSDFYGRTFRDTLSINWSGFEDDITGLIVRDFNQGLSYTRVADSIEELTNRSYNSSLRVARTEAHRIQSMAYIDALLLLDDVGADYGKMWIATIDDRTREDHLEMDGQLADSDGVFTLPNGATGPAPGLTGDASTDINCRCSAITLINGETPKQRRVDGEVIPFTTWRKMQ
jgi:hypothetical protein